MKLHSLTIQGFGPFKDKQEIDFDALSQDRIFMLEGPTGAGKSSIIDAIVYALYGSTAHEAATKSGPAGQRIRSDYCGVGDETKVVLEFTTGGARYRVSRTAAYDAPKKNGDGTTPVNAKAVLEFINPAYEAIYQVKEVNLRIKEELRLDNEQFSQMVVLPQGDFASFLHASTEKRREVLESIFKTFFYDKIKGEVDARAKEILSLLAGEKQNISHHIRNLEDETTDETADIDFDDLEKLISDSNLPRKERDASLAAVVSRLRPQVDFQTEKKTQLEKELAPLNSDLTALEESHQKIDEKRKLNEELVQLKEQSEEFNEKEAQLRARHKVSGLQEILQTRDSAQEAMDAALEKIDEEYAELTAAQVSARINKLTKEVPTLATKSSEASKASDELEELNDAIEEAQEYEAQIKALPGLVTKVAAVEKKLATAKTKVKN